MNDEKYKTIYSDMPNSLSEYRGTLERDLARAVLFGVVFGVVLFVVLCVIF